MPKEVLEVLEVLNDLITQNEGFCRELVRLHEEVLILRQENAALHRAALTDALTDVPNRHAYEAALDVEVSRARRNKDDLCLAYLDLDNFKGINDTFGHPVGDRLLKKAAELLKGRIRVTDFVARIGGEEFAIILPGMSLSVAHQFMERIRKVIEEDMVVDTHCRTTVSVGVSSLLESDTIESFVQRADKALYEAKIDRNKVVKMN